MRSGSQPSIWRDANRLLLEIEQVVRCFPRDHKYATGTELCRHAWLNMFFSLRGHRLLPRRELASVSSYRYHYNWFRREFPAARVTIQRGGQTDIFRARQRDHPIPCDAEKALRYRVKWIVVREQGYIKGGLKRRVLEKATLDRGIGCATAI